MAFKLIILISVSSIWFIFGSIFFYRSTWGPEKFNRHTGTLEEIGTTIVKVKREQNVVFFRLKGNTQVFGIPQTRAFHLEKLLSQIKIGDTLSVYYTDYLLKADKPINLYVTHFQSNSKSFINYKDLNKQYFWTGIILYVIDLIFSAITVWYYRRYSRVSTKFFKQSDDYAISV